MSTDKEKEGKVDQTLAGISEVEIIAALERRLRSQSNANKRILESLAELGQLLSQELEPDTETDWSEIVRTRGRGYISGKFHEYMFPDSYYPVRGAFSEQGGFGGIDTGKGFDSLNISEPISALLSEYSRAAYRDFQDYRPGQPRSADQNPQLESVLSVTPSFSADSEHGKRLKLRQGEEWRLFTYQIFQMYGGGDTGETRIGPSPVRLFFALPSELARKLISDVPKKPEIPLLMVANLYPQIRGKHMIPPNSVAIFECPPEMTTQNQGRGMYQQRRTLPTYKTPYYK